MSMLSTSTLIAEPLNKDEVMELSSSRNTLDDFGLLTLETVAKLLHCSKAHVSNVIAGRIHDCPPIPAVRIGRRKLVRREALANWIEHNEGADGSLDLSPEQGRKNA